MSVTTSSYTTASIKITVSNETSSTNIISAVDSSIRILGWTLYDNVAASTYSPIVTNVYSALCSDGVYYKYFITRWDTIQRQLYTSVCQSWSTSTHTPTNECWTSTGGFAQGYDTQNCFFLVAGSQYHLMIWPWINNNPGLWTACMEFERVAQEDTFGTPNFAWTNSLMIGTPFGQAVNTQTSQIMLSFPQTPDGINGPGAAQVYATMTNRGMFPPLYPQISDNLYPLDTADVNLLHLGSYYNMTYGWNQTNSIVSPISTDAITKTMPFGRAFNWGVTKPFGNALDQTTLLGDAVGGWPNGSGTSTNYLILGMSGGCESDPNAIAYGSGRCVLNGYGQATGGQLFSGKVIQVGSTAYFGGSDGIRSYTITNQAASATTTLVYSNANGVYDLVFDGQQTIYGSISTGLVSLNINTLSTATLAVGSGGTGYLGIDNAYVYATSRVSSTTPTVYTIARSNFTLNGSGCTLSSATTAATSFSTPTPDYQGHVYVTTTPGIATTNTFRVAAYNSQANTSFITANHPIFGNTAQTTAGVQPNGLYYDVTSGRLFMPQLTSNLLTIYELSTSTLVQIGSAATLGTITAGTGYVSGTYNGVTLTTLSGTVPSAAPTANITVSGGAVTAVTLLTGGLGVSTSTVLTATTSSIGGSGSGFSVPVATLAAAASNTITLSGLQSYSQLAPSLTLDFKGDLSIVPWRGEFIISNKKVASTASFIAKVLFSNPQSASGLIPAGYPKFIYTATSAALLTVPGGSSAGIGTNGVTLTGTIWNATNDSRIYSVSNLYNMNNIAGNATGRLLLKC